MRKIKILLSVFLLSLAVSSCEKFLDVNKNPNAASDVTPTLILPTTIVRAASSTVTYNTYGGSLAGYIANAGGFSGFGSLLNYNFTPGTHSNWGTAYDNLNDIRYVIEKTDADPNMVYFNAAARIMFALEFHRIVDQHGDVPYTEGAMGNRFLSPKYDKAEDIYQDLIAQLNKAIADIKGAAALVNPLTAPADPLFKGNTGNWVKFANTLKLRLLIRLSGVSSLSAFVNAEFASLENNFLTEDAVVNPGYAKDRANPTWGTWGYTATGNVANSSRVPTYFVYGFYDGTKLADPGRGRLIYNDFGNTTRPTPLNQLGVESGNPPIRAGYSPWYTGTSASNAQTDALGVVKGFAAGQPIMLAAESYLLQAEAIVKGKLTGNAKTAFDNGIKASFNYLHKDVNGAANATNVTNTYNEYYTLNETNRLVRFELATTDAQKLEAIITQKYIAFNMINGDEAWNDYRRTGYPKTNPAGDKYNNMASTTSNSTRADKLPSILKYPQSEYDYNSANVKDLNQFVDKLFWAQ